MKDRITALSLGVALFLMSGTAHAQLLIQQGKIVLNILPGESVMKTIDVHNTSDKKMDVQVRWEDFEYVHPFDGKKTFYPSGTLPTSAGQWVQFSPQSLTLGPKSKEKITYSIAVPEGVRGGFNGVLFFETGGERPQGQVGVRIVTRVGALFFVETADVNREAVVEDFHGAPQGLAAVFSNKGNLILIPQGLFFVMDKDGMVVERGDVANFYLPPGQQVGFQVPLSTDLPDGRYTCVLTFDLEGGVSLVKETDFRKTGGQDIEILPAEL